VLVVCPQCVGIFPNDPNVFFWVFHNVFDGSGSPSPRSTDCPSALRCWPSFLPFFPLLPLAVRKISTGEPCFFSASSFFECLVDLSECLFFSSFAMFGLFLRDDVVPSTRFLISGGSSSTFLVVVMMTCGLPVFLVFSSFGEDSRCPAFLLLRFLSRL